MIKNIRLLLLFMVTLSCSSIVLAGIADSGIVVRGVDRGDMMRPEPEMELCSGAGLSHFPQGNYTLPTKVTLEYKDNSRGNVICYTNKKAASVQPDGDFFKEDLEFIKENQHVLDSYNYCEEFNYSNVKSPPNIHLVKRTISNGKETRELICYTSNPNGIGVVKRMDGGAEETLLNKASHTKCVKVLGETECSIYEAQCGEKQTSTSAKFCKEADQKLAGGSAGSGSPGTGGPDGSPGTGDGDGSGDGDGTPGKDGGPINQNTAGVCRTKLKTLKAEYEAQCKTPQTKAEYCCGPGATACLVGMDNPKDSGASMIAIGGMLAQTLVGMRQMQGMANNCDNQAGLANFSAGINAAGAAKCYTIKNACETSCDIVKQRIEREKDNCTDHNSIEFERLADRTTRKIKTCKGYVSNVTQMGALAGTSLMSTAQMAKLCKDVVAASPPPVAPGIAGNDLCNDPSDLSNPYCRQQFCSQPGAASAPECQVADENGLQKVGAVPNNQIAGSSFGVRGTDLSGIDEGAQGQGPGFKPTDPEANRVAQTPGGGGGGPAGRGGGGGGASGYGAGGGGGGARAKLKTGILNGFSGGSGYSVSKMGLAGGGGYSNPVRGQGGKKAKPFDLKQFLPKKAPQRKLAGLKGPAGANSELAGKHDNIFNRVSNKYHEMCIRQKLWCSKGKR